MGELPCRGNRIRGCPSLLKKREEREARGACFCEKKNVKKKKRKGIARHPCLSG